MQRLTELSHTRLFELEKQFGPSFYVVDLELFRQNLNSFRQAFTAWYENTGLAYSYKTNYIPALCLTALEAGAYAEVVSPMEYDLALRIGNKPTQIIFNGPVKPFDYVESAMNSGAIVNLDSMEEFEFVQSMASRSEQPVEIGLRCCVGEEPSRESRFGISAANGDLERVQRSVTDHSGLSIVSLHSHYSCGRNAESFANRTEQLCDVFDEMANQPIKIFDIGGGFYGEMPDVMRQQFASNPTSLAEYAETVGTIAKTRLTSRNPQLVLEPGVAVVANTMSFVCRVESVKVAPSRRIANTTGSVQNIKPSKSRFKLPVHAIRPASDATGDSPTTSDLPTDICGYTCMEDDVLYHEYESELACGDYVMFSHTGAYSIVFKPPFIRACPAILAWDSNDGRCELVRRPESLDDVLATYILPSKSGSST